MPGRVANRRFATRNGHRLSAEMAEHPTALHERLPVSLILAVSMIAAGVVYPVTDSALKHTSAIMIATLRAVVGGVILTLMLPLVHSRLLRTRRLWGWAA